MQLEWGVIGADTLGSWAVGVACLYLGEDARTGNERRVHVAVLLTYLFLNMKTVVNHVENTQDAHTAFPPPPIFHISAPWKGDVLAFRGVASSLLLIVSPPVSVWLNDRVAILPVREVRVNGTHVPSRSRGRL